MSKFFISGDNNFHLEDHQWDGYTLILPCISVGNVPQLAIDLLINHLLKHDEYDLQFVGHIRSKHVRPFAGPDSYKMGGNLLTTSIQVFESKSNKLVIIQQRSPIYKQYRNNFYEELFNWLKPHRFELILLLSSSFDHFLSPELIDRNENKIPMMYLESNLNSNLKTFLEQNLNVKPVMKVDPESMKPTEQGKIHLPGSGSARSFLKYFSQHYKNDNNDTKILCLVMFCSEGDNRFHSFRLADRIADIMNHLHSPIVINKPGKYDQEDDSEESLFQERYRWSIPFSWRLMFGDEAPSEIY